MDIRIKINEKEITWPSDEPVSKLLEIMEFGIRVAVWVNGSQLLLSDYPLRTLKNGDQIKVRRIVAGG